MAVSCSGVAPMMEIMPEGLASQASCMYLPRAWSTRRVVSKSRTPAAQRAVHSPRERPAAAAAGTSQRLRKAAWQAMETVKMAGWQTSERVRASAGPSKQSFLRSKPRTSLALSKRAMISGSASARSLPIPGNWAP